MPRTGPRYGERVAEIGADQVSGHGCIGKKETPLSRHAFAEKKRIKANKNTKAEAKRSVRSGSLRKIKTYFSPKIESRSKNIAHQPDPGTPLFSVSRVYHQDREYRSLEGCAGNPPLLYATSDGNILIGWKVSCRHPPYVQTAIPSPLKIYRFRRLSIATPKINFRRGNYYPHFMCMDPTDGGIFLYPNIRLRLVQPQPKNHFHPAKYNTKIPQSDPTDR
jgi:hypothetical protein